MEIKNLNRELLPIYRVPLLTWSLANSFIKAKEFIPKINGHSVITTYQGGEFMFALKTKDDSMEPEFNQGTTIIVDPDIKPKHDDYVVVQDKQSQEATLRQLKRWDGKIVLHPLNPKYPDIDISSDLKRYVIVGKIVKKDKSY